VKNLPMMWGCTRCNLTCTKGNYIFVNPSLLLQRINALLKGLYLTLLPFGWETCEKWHLLFEIGGCINLQNKELIFLISTKNWKLNVHCLPYIKVFCNVFVNFWYIYSFSLSSQKLTMLFFLHKGFLQYVQNMCANVWYILSSLLPNKVLTNILPS
jgi:hypothetical protein